MPRTLVSLGANLGNVQESMYAAKRMLIDIFGNGSLQFSQLYRTPPVGGPAAQSDFLNAVVAIHSNHSCWEIWESIKQVESQLGRHRIHRWEARRIDLDLILHDRQRVWTPHLKIPHPRMCTRSFVLQPALDVAADWVDPITGWTLERMASHIANHRQVGSAICILCPSTEELDRIRSAYEAVPTKERDHPTIDWGIALPEVRSHGPSTRIEQPVQSWLTMMPIATPDPMTILWEDASRPWVEWLGLNSTDDGLENVIHPGTIAGPRYLLPGNDLPWVLHEIDAAHQAMRCPVQAVDNDW